MNSQQASHPQLNVSQLSWHADNKRILDNISFSVHKGRFIGLIGPNGAGKSSLLRCLYRYITPSQGQVHFEQQNIWKISANDYAKKTAVVLQETPSHFNLSVLDVVALGLVPHKSFLSNNSRQDQQQVIAALNQVGLRDKINQEFEHLSGGEKQRALIARAIVQSPQLLIMDEPTSHLDVKYQIQIMALAKSLGITIIASFHDLNLASALCDDLLVLDQGKLVAQGKPATVMTQSMLCEVFGINAQISQHPAHGTPHITYFYGEEQTAL